MANDTYVLVHGSWMGKFCWAEVVPMLEALGSAVLTLDLPAHGDDSTPSEKASLDGYRDAVLAVIGDRNDVTLVGHSMAGMVISAVLMFKNAFNCLHHTTHSFQCPDSL